MGVLRRFFQYVLEWPYIPGSGGVSIQARYGPIEQPVLSYDIPAHRWGGRREDAPLTRAELERFYEVLLSHLRNAKRRSVAQARNYTMFVLAAESGWLFLSERGRPLGKGGATYELQKLTAIGRDAGLRIPPRFGWHSLRRSFSTIFMEERPDSPWVLMEMLGHSNSSTLHYYIHQLDSDRLEPREVLVIYLLCFYGLRTHEIVELRALGFRSVRGNETFDLELSPAVISAGSFRATRGDRVLHLPTGRYPWRRRIVTEVVDERAGVLKNPDGPYLLVSPSWRRSGEAMLPPAVSRLVTKASQRLLGFGLSPDILRQTAGAYSADMSDHMICCTMGWSPERAVDLAYGTREIVGLDAVAVVP